MAKRKAEGAGQLATVTIEFPIVDLNPEHYQARHVEVQLDGRQRASLSRLRAGLESGHLKLANGKPVWSNADAVRWLIEQVSD